MANEDNIIEAKGLSRNSNDIILPRGGLVAADECIINKDNIISRRRGFKLCNTGLPANLPEQLFVSGGRLYVNENGNLYVKDSACNYTLVNSLTPPIGIPTAIANNGNKIYFSTASVPGVIRNIMLLDLDANLISRVATLNIFTVIFALWSNSTDLYIADYGNSCISKYNYASKVMTLSWAGLNGVFGYVDAVGAAARFHNPGGIWGDVNNIYVSDTTNQVIRQIDIATQTVTTLAGSGVAGNANGIGVLAQFNLPGSLGGNATNLFIVDQAGTSIRKINIATTAVTTVSFTGFVSANTLLVIGSTGLTAANYSIGIGNLGGGLFQPVYAGNLTNSGFVNGVLTDARFNTMWQMCIIGTDVYICDQLNNLIRKFDYSLTGAVTTAAGVPGDSSIGSGYLSLNVEGPT